MPAKQPPTREQSPAQAQPRRVARRSLVRHTASEQVAADIRQAIITGDMRAGDRVRQENIAEELGVSRIPVREAILALEREGWLKIESNRSAYVTGLSEGDIRDHYELRGLLLGLVADRATAAAGPEDLDELAAALASLRAADDEAEFGVVNEVILRKLVRLADSPRLSAALRVTVSIVGDAFFEVVPGSRKIQEQGLAVVIRAMKAGDRAKVDEAMRTMLRRQGEAVIEAFATRGVLSGEQR